LFILWMFGKELANMWGSKRFLTFYILSGIAGGLAQILLGNSAWTIGASAAVYGVMVAFAMTFPNQYIIMLFPPIPMKVKYFVIFIVVIEYLFSWKSARFILEILGHLGWVLVFWPGCLYVSLLNMEIGKRFFNHHQFSSLMINP